MDRRLERVREEMEKRELDGFYIARPVNVNYISGYTSSDASLLITRETQYFLTDPRYTEQASMECPQYTIENWRKVAPNKGAYAGMLAARDGLRRVGFEADFLTCEEHQQMQQCAGGSELIAANGIVEEFRSVKNEQEQQYQRIACEISCRAFTRICQDIRVGVTEKELAARLSLYMVLEGADTQPYGNILISGPRTSLLHGIPGTRALEYGDFVLMDYGCQYHGYLSDMTRTVVVGRANARQREVYRLEQEMVAIMEKLIRPGVSAKAVYEASTEPIRDTEYFPYHYTGIGHGIGQFVHEIPFLGPNNETLLRENQIMTVEPGIYIPGWGGVRIEDQGLITKEGYEVLTPAPKELIEL